MARFQFRILIICASMPLIGCSQEPGAMTESGPLLAMAQDSAVSAPEAAIAAVSAAQNSMPDNARKLQIIREGELKWQTDDPQQTRATIESAVRQYDGYLADEEEVRRGDRREQTLVIRVPATHFDSLVRDISDGVTHFDTRRIEAKDVTEEFVDIEARLQVGRDTETRYRELLSKAESVEDVLKVEAELARIRAEIESADGRLRYLRDRTSLSTLRVTYYETAAAADGFWYRIQSSLRLGWVGVVELIIALTVVWPLMLVGAAVALAVRLTRRPVRGVVRR